jgi:signal transduction histidine kinase
VVSSVHHLASLVDRLLDLSEIERGKPTLHIEPVDIGQVVDRALVAYPPPPGRTVKRDVPPGSRALVDELSLEQALTNLLTNAYRYGGDHVVVAARGDDGQLLLSVTDDGPGVDAAIETTLFEPFVRSLGSPGGGSGMGLAISRRLMEAMGGTLHYERREGGGSRFVIAVPRP